MKPRIYDCFCYFNEDMILELRLETLWNHVDFFVIVESTRTISGNPKPQNFQPEKFAKYASKIRYLLIDEYPFPTDDQWRNERYQRNFTVNGLQDAADTDWIMVSDLDEIPNPDAIRLFDPQKYLRADLEQYAYSYYLNNQCMDQDGPSLWYGSKIVTFQTFKAFFGGAAEHVRNYKSSGLLRGFKRWWFKRYRVQIIRRGGWHFTWIASIPQIIQKLESFAHQEFNLPEYKDPDKIREKIASGQDILNPRVRFVRQRPDSGLPEQLAKYPEKFGDWLLPT